MRHKRKQQAGGGGTGMPVLRAVAFAVSVAAVLVLAWPVPSAEAQTRPRPRPDRSAADLGASQMPAARPAPRPPSAVPAQVQSAPLEIGPVTKQPLPRFVSLKGGEGNARRGPGLTHRIDWVFTTKSTPLRVTAEFENWRRVEDFEGFGGWVHFTLLSVSRTVLITEDMAQFRKLPDPNAPVSFQAERGVLARLLECHIDWCRVAADGERGWAPKSVMWGVDPQEVVR